MKTSLSIFPRCRGLWLAGGLLAVVLPSWAQLAVGSRDPATEAALAAALAAAPVVARRVVNLGDQTVTLVGIRKPDLPVLEARPEAVLTVAERAVSVRRERKAWRAVSLFATAYAGSGSEWTVRAEGSEVHGFSNVDLRALSPVFEVETATALFTWFGAIGGGLPEEAPAALRRGAKEGPSATGPDFVVTQAKGDPAAVGVGLDFLDAVHGFYAANKAALDAALARRLEEEAARARKPQEPPPRPADTTVHFWRVADEARR